MQYRELIRIGIVSVLLFCCGFGNTQEPAKQAATTETPRIQIAVLLDTSSSMDGLINQTRNQLWDIINDFTRVKQQGKTPELEVALYHYGNDRLSKESGYIEQLTPFTDNLDLISEKLFALKTNGGLEYCGQVIQQAVDELKWSTRPDDLRLIFIAGNEPFTQGEFPYYKACRNAVEKYIVVNTIHCGGEQEGKAGKWEDGALLTDGKYLFIDQNVAVPSIPAPQDKRIVELNSELNGTYIAYGKEGAAGAANQLAQDSLNTSNAAGRALSKANAFYRNSSWDLVDASKEKDFDISKIAEEDLPENLKKMSVDERKKFVESQTTKRKEIQSEINKLAVERQKFIDGELKKQNKGDDQSLGNAVLRATRSQAIGKKFEYEEPTNTPQTEESTEKPKDTPKFFRPMMKTSLGVCERGFPLSTSNPDAKKQTDDEKEAQIEKILTFMEQKEPKLFAASAELIESFNNKTYDTKKSAEEITENIKLFKETDTALSVITMFFVERFEKEKLAPQELELARRVIGLSAEHLKNELKKSENTPPNPKGQDAKP